MAYKADRKMSELKELLEFGIINIDKSTGPTSFSVGQFIMKSLKLRKTSHMGTLDPMVSGVLPIMLNRACKLSNYFMKKDKKYVGIMRLHEDISEEALKKEMSKFVGKIKQIPPVRSAVKRAQREREVMSFDFVEKDGKDVLFETKVEAGTYIRKLVSDLGEGIGGAHMIELRRVEAGIFDESSSVDLYEFEEAIKDEKKLKKIIFPAEKAIKEIMPSVKVKRNVGQLLTGKPIMEGDLDRVPEETFAVFDKEKFIGVYVPVKDKGGIVARPEFVKN